VLDRRQRQTGNEKALVIVLEESEVVLPWADMVDVAAEKLRLGKEIDILKREIDRLDQRLKDSAFVTKAPAAVVEKETQKLHSYRDKLSRLEQELSQLN